MFSNTYETALLELVLAYRLTEFIADLNINFQFEHIYAISMKERTDKRDFLTLAASISGFKVEWLEGVRPDDLHPKAMPDVCSPVQ